jgi:hypothetical protein
MRQKREKWIRWLERIKQQLHAVMESRHVFEETFRLIRENPALPRESLIYLHLRIWYGDHAVMAVRRQIKNDPSAISLLRLLLDVQGSAHVITREEWLAAWDDWRDDPIAVKSWDGVAGPGALALDPAIVAADIALLRQTAADIERFADKRVAQHDAGREPDPPTYDQLNACLDRLDELFRKYYRLDAGKSLLIKTPSIAYNWMRAYEHPWRSH